MARQVRRSADPSTRPLVPRGLGRNDGTVGVWRATPLRSPNAGGGRLCGAGGIVGETGNLTDF